MPSGPDRPAGRSRDCRFVTRDHCRPARFLSESEAMTGESGPSQAGPPPRDRRPGGWLLPAAVALLTLVAIAGAVARRGLELDQNGPLSANRDAVVAIAAVFTVANLVLVLTIAVMMRRRRRRKRMPDSPPLEEVPVPAWALWLRRLAVFAFFFLLLAPLLLLISSLGPT